MSSHHRIHVPNLTLAQKPRSLPFRSSPTSKHTLLFSQSTRSTPTPIPATLTPAESSEDDDYFSSTRRTSQHKSLAYQATQTMQVDYDPDLDSDLDMADSQPPESPVWTKGDSSPTVSPTTCPTLRAPRLLPNERTRIPTPIYGYFPLLEPSAMAISAPFSRNATITTTFATQSNNPTSQNQPFFLNRRSLPSPISEDEAMDSPTTMTGSMLHRLNMNHHAFPKPSPASKEQISDSMDINEPTPASSPSEDAMAETPMSFRHQTQNETIRDARRGAVTNLNTLSQTHQQQHGKMTLSMGFRADCEKCRERVPGHWSHVLRV